MAHRARNEQTELNFDGLTDSVTNLVGALILLVVLVIGVTKEALPQGATVPPPPQAGAPDAAERSILPLQQRIASLQSEIKQVDRDIEGLDERMRQIREEAEELFRRVQEVQPPAADEEVEPPPEKSARAVKFRPPLERRDERDAMTFVVADGGVNFLDFEALNTQLRASVVAGESEKGRTPVDFEIAGTAFRVSGSVAGGGDMDLAVTRVPGAAGSIDEFKRKLALIDNSEHTLDFIVYPDSMEMFRTLRTLAWDRKFDVGWTPMAAGESVKLGRGFGGSTIQ